MNNILYFWGNDPDIDRPDPNKRGFGFKDSEGKEINLDR